MKPRIFDCFTFFNEIEILDLRFQETYDTVDFFVIAESELTFTGLKKPLYFKEYEERFKPYMDKVIHLVVNDVPDSKNPFDREHFQRNAVVRGLGSAQGDDLIMISDVDELIRPEAMRAASLLDGYITFDMAMYQFYLNLCERPRSWFAAYAFKHKFINRIPDLSVARWKRDFLKEGFSENGHSHVLPDAGWHFTHLGGIDRIQKKFSSYSHNPDPWPRAMMNNGALQKHIVAGGTVGDFKHLAKFVPIDSTFPKCVVSQEPHFREIGFIKDIYEALDELQKQHRQIKQALAIEFYDDPNPSAALYGLPPKIFAKMSGLTPPFESRIAALKPKTGSLLSSGKRATQSSLSQWSKGASLESDASGALDGHRTGEYKFHTLNENQPWWMVDLESPSIISEVHIYNRIFPEHARGRARHLKIEVAIAADSWAEVYRKEDDTLFGGADGSPLIWVADRPIIGRLLRITLLNHTSMHLDQVEVYGTVESEDAVGGDPVFTSDWFSALGAVWRDIFRSQSWDSSKPKTIVELGCFEGRATLWILENLLMNPASRLHCVDVFPDDDKPETYGARHRRNVRTSPRANMVTRHAVYSYDFLLDFVHKGGKADFIYIDASHRSPEVLEDLILAFQALNVGGVIICDDYLGGAPDPKSEGILSTPKMAIDVFTTLFRDRLQILRGQPLYQMAFIKTAGRGRDDPSSRGWS